MRTMVLVPSGNTIELLSLRIGVHAAQLLPTHVCLVNYGKLSGEALNLLSEVGGPLASYIRADTFCHVLTFDSNTALDDPAVLDLIRRLEEQLYISGEASSFWSGAFNEDAGIGYVVGHQLTPHPVHVG